MLLTQWPHSDHGGKKGEMNNIYFNWLFFLQSQNILPHSARFPRAHVWILYCTWLLRTGMHLRHLELGTWTLHIMSICHHVPCPMRMQFDLYMWHATCTYLVKDTSTSTCTSYCYHPKSILVSKHNYGSTGGTSTVSIRRVHTAYSIILHATGMLLLPLDEDMDRQCWHGFWTFGARTRFWRQYVF